MAMQSNVRPSLHLALALGALLCASVGAARAADAPAGAQIYQQRAADGRIVLTDRPSPTAVTERTWQMDREDPAAAAQRALEVRREADVVSERVQRRIDAQQRALDYDLERMRLAQRERELQLQYAGADGNYDAVPVILAPAGNRQFTSRRMAPGQHRPPQHRPGHAPARILPVS
jgi:hypothetical protein